MSCSAAPVALRARDDCMAQIPGVYDSGIVASQQHSADCHRSSHNCASTCGGQESGNYDPAYAHAWDAGHGGNRATAKIIRTGFLADGRCRYCIDNAIIYYPDGSWSHGSGHPTHVHTSFLPGTTFDTRPFTFATQGDDDAMLSKEAQDWLDKRAMEQDDRIVARVTKELLGTAKEPAGLAVAIHRNKVKLVRLLKHFGLPTKD